MRLISDERIGGMSTEILEILLEVGGIHQENGRGIKVFVERFERPIDQMRLLLKLRALKEQAYDLKYHHKLQGFIYDLLDGTPYAKLHDRHGYKFFCFSNIFPPENMQTGSIRNLIISSPDLGLIEVLNRKIAGAIEGKKTANVGEMSFELEEVRLLKPRLGRSCRLITGTPIIIRIPKENYEKYGIKPPKDYDYVYWRKRYSFEAFIKQLEDNLFKKYDELYGLWRSFRCLSNSYLKSRSVTTL